MYVFFYIIVGRHHYHSHHFSYWAMCWWTHFFYMVGKEKTRVPSVGGNTGGVGVIYFTMIFIAFPLLTTMFRPRCNFCIFVPVRL